MITELGLVQSKIIETPRLKLLPLTLRQLILMITDLSEVEKDIGLPISASNVNGVVQRAIGMKIAKMENTPERLHPWVTYWLMIIKDRPFGAGSIGFKGAPDENGECEIGYGIDPAYRGNGYTSEAADAMLSWAFHDPRCKTVTAKMTLKNNIPSNRILSKLGFSVYEKTEEWCNWAIGYTIRPGCKEDIAFLPNIEIAAGKLFLEAGLVHTANKPPLAMDFLLNQARKGMLWVICDMLDHPIGFAVLLNLGTGIHLEEIDVHPTHARRRLGTRLIEHLCDWAFVKGYAKMTLITFKDLPWNAPFYQKLGFKTVGTDELNPQLEKLLANETLQGVPAEQRICMQVSTHGKC
jgi:RimJ/RimL family protein N-acetyltransferase